jgi:plastocyanin
MEDAAMKSQRIVWLALAGVLVIALLAACSGGTVGGTNAPASGSSGGKTYNVAATEFQYAPNKFDATVGQKVTFNLNNKGTVEHTFVILSLDGSQELLKIDTQPGETKSGDFTPTAAGTYKIQCDIAGHKEAGMTGEVDVK